MWMGVGMSHKTRTGGNKRNEKGKPRQRLETGEKNYVP